MHPRYEQAFLDTIPGATSKELLVREEDVQVLHRFITTAGAQACLGSELFTRDVVGALCPLSQAEPDVHIYETA